MPIRCMTDYSGSSIEVEVLQFVVKNDKTYGVCRTKGRRFFIEVSIDQLRPISF